MDEQPAALIVIEARKFNFMEHKDIKFSNSILIFAFGLIAGLYYGASFFIPFTFGAFLAALMAPFSDLLERTKMGRTFSSLLSTLVVLIVVGGLSYLFFWQLKLFANDLPQIKEELTTFFKRIQAQLSSATGISMEEQEKILQERSESIMGVVQKQAASLFGNVMNVVFKFLLVLIYVFLFLLYRQRFSDFVMKYVPQEKKKRAKVVLGKTAKVVHHYLWGRVKVMSILAIMYLAAFLIFDVRYTILLTVFGALITIIPYIGPFISGVLPVIFMIIFGGSFTEIMVFAAVILVIQLIESYVLEPVIIGSEVQLNPLTVIISIIVGGMIWGIAGMILFVPLFAIIKIVSDNTANLKPIGFLIGDTEDEKPKTGIGTKIKGLFLGSK